MSRPNLVGNKETDPIELQSVYFWLSEINVGNLKTEKDNNNTDASPWPTPTTMSATYLLVSLVVVVEEGLSRAGVRVVV